MNMFLGKLIEVVCVFNNIRNIMPHLIPNLFQKGYTPYTVKLAPKNLWSKPTLGKSMMPSDSVPDVLKVDTEPNAYKA